MGRRFVRKLFLAVTSMALALTLVGGAYALTGESTEEPQVEQTETGEPEPVEEETEAPEPVEEETEAPEPVEEEEEAGDDDGVHGGSVARIHEGCDGVEGLEGNWTHGDYVKAVGEQSGKEAKKAAAKSDCGKPDKGKRARGDDAKKEKKEKKAKKGGKPGSDSGGDDDGSGEDEPVTE